MTVHEAIAEIRKAGTVRVENGKLKLRFPEPERARLEPAIEVLRRDREAALRSLMNAEGESTGSRCKAAQNSGSDYAGIQNAPVTESPRRRANGADTAGGEIALRWYCSTCGTGGVLWHLPEVTCDAKERAIIRAHSERQPGCRRLDYRVVSGLETRPRRGAA